MRPLPEVRGAGAPPCYRAATGRFARERGGQLPYMTRLAEELRAVLGSREPHQPRQEPSPAAIEEETATRLYGERTGMVNASPASPPVAGQSEHAEHTESVPAV